MKQIRQATTTESLFMELQRWCRSGASRKRDVLQIMSAFASGSAVEALEPLFDIFLSDGNSIDFIIGIDRNGTSQDAISRLYELSHAYTKQITCRVFHAPSSAAIFHPKLYLYHRADKLSAVTGSANLTLGGLAHNFESLFLYKDISRSSVEARALVDVWNTFAHPAHPLKGAFLRPLTKDYSRELLRKLPKYSQIEQKIPPSGIGEIWKPISKVSLPRSRTKIQKGKRAATKPKRAFLAIDILTETRETQMQFPLAVVERFFGIERHKEGSIPLSQIRAGELTQPIERPVVISSGRQGSRLMRRIEMPQIAGKLRPLAAIFLRFTGKTFAVAIVPRGTSAYTKVNRFLDTHGEQPQHAVRRYYVGAADDPLLKELQPVLDATALS